MPNRTTDIAACCQSDAVWLSTSTPVHAQSSMAAPCVGHAYPLALPQPHQQQPGLTLMRCEHRPPSACGSTYDVRRDGSQVRACTRACVWAHECERKQERVQAAMHACMHGHCRSAAQDLPPHHLKLNTP